VKTKATDALLKDHQMINKTLEGFRLDNPRFPKIAATFHRILKAHAWFEDEIFLPAVEHEPAFFRRFTQEISQEHKDLDALTAIIRKTPLTGGKDLENHVRQLRVLLSTHFHKEEDALFPIAENVLSGEGLLELGDEMERRKSEVRGLSDD